MGTVKRTLQSAAGRPVLSVRSWQRKRYFLAILSLLLILPDSALAASRVEVLLRGAVLQDGQDNAVVELRILNSGDSEDSIALPDRVEARIDSRSSGSSGIRTIVLTRAADTPASLVIAAHGFAEARYNLPAGDVRQDALLSIPGWSGQAVRLTPPEPIQMAGQGDAAVIKIQPAAPPTDRSAGNAFLDNLVAYEPIYAVYGPGTNTEARLQFSFKYRLFGSRAISKQPDGLYLAYTQRMFWDLEAQSLPFRNIDFQPEIIYITPPVTLGSGITLAAQGGFRHESNGREGPQSRSINSLYVAPMAAVPLSGGYRLSVAPRFSVYVGDKSGNPDIARYRGHAELFLEVGKDDGLRLSTTTRFNPDSGKGSFSADLSYPLPRFWGGAPDFYLFAQSFIGYGENLLDYNQRTTRLRIGIALVR